MALTAKQIDDLLDQLPDADEPSVPRLNPERDPGLQPDTGFGEAMNVASDAGNAVLPALLNAAQGASFGTFDEITSPFQTGRDAESFRRSRNESYPAAGMLAEAGGGLATGAAAFPKAAAYTARMANPIQRTMANWLGGGLAGATYGGASSEGGNRLPAAAQEGAMALALTPALTAAGRMGGAITRPATDAFGSLWRSADEEAATLLSRGRSNEGIPTDMAYQDAQRQQLNPLGDTGLTINADLDPVARQTLKEVYDSQPAMRPEIEGVLDTRQRAAPQRVIDDVSEVTGLNRDSRKQIEASLEQSRKDMAAKNYDRLYAEDSVEISDELGDMFLGPEGADMRSAYKAAEKIAAREGDPIPRYDDVFDDDTGTLEALPLKAVDYMQRAFRNKGRPNMADPDHDIHSWRALRDRFLAAVDSQVPEFKDARRTYATQTSLQDALEEGRKVYSIDDLTEYTQTLSDPELQAFQRGALDAIEKKVKHFRFKAGNIDTKLGGSLADQEVIDTVFGDKADTVCSILGREDTYNTTFSRTLGGSPTTRNAGGVLTPTPIDTRGGITERITGAAEDTLGRAYGQPHPTTINAMLKMLLADGYTEEQSKQMLKRMAGDEAAQRFGWGAASTSPAIGHRARSLFFPDEDE